MRGREVVCGKGSGGVTTPDSYDTRWAEMRRKLEALIVKWRGQAANGERIGREHPGLVEPTVIHVFNACADELEALLAGPVRVLRCIERHSEEGQCELTKGHDGQHLAGTAIWGRA